MKKIICAVVTASFLLAAAGAHAQGAPAKIGYQVGTKMEVPAITDDQKLLMDLGETCLGYQGITPDKVKKMGKEGVEKVLEMQRVKTVK